MPAEYGYMHPVFHVSYLWFHLEPTPPLPLVPVLLDNMAAGEYEGKYILNSHIDHSGSGYLMKWLGYLVFESTWELPLHIANAPDNLY